MQSRTIGAIALRPTGNEQGGHHFRSLSTGRRLDRQRWTKLPMSNDVIDGVHTLARRSKASAGITFGWRDGSEINPDEDDDDSIADPDCDPEEEQCASNNDDDTAASTGVSKHSTEDHNADDASSGEEEDAPEHGTGQQPATIQTPARNNSDNPAGTTTEGHDSTGARMREHETTGVAERENAGVQAEVQQCRSVGT